MKNAFRRGFSIIELFMYMAILAVFLALLIPSIIRKSWQEENWVHTVTNDAADGHLALEKKGFLCVRSKRQSTAGTVTPTDVPLDQILEENTTYYALDATRNPSEVEYTLRDKYGVIRQLKITDLRLFSEKFELTIHNIPHGSNKDWRTEQQAYAKMYKEFWGEEVGK